MSSSNTNSKSNDHGNMKKMLDESRDGQDFINDMMEVDRDEEEEEEEEKIMGKEEEEEEALFGLDTNDDDHHDYINDYDDIITSNDGCFMMSSSIPVGTPLVALVGSCPNPMDMIPRSPTYHHHPPPVVAPPMPLNANALRAILQDALDIVNESEDIFD